jgi:hypothetical protein
LLPTDFKSVVYAIPPLARRIYAPCLSTQKFVPNFFRKLRGEFPNLREKGNSRRRADSNR